MKPKTKNQRLIDCFDAYHKTVGGRPCTTSEVAEWMLARGLVPIPSMRDSQALRDAWDAKFAEVTK